MRASLLNLSRLWVEMHRQRLLLTISLIGGLSLICGVSGTDRVQRHFPSFYFIVALGSHGLLVGLVSLPWL